MQKSPFTIESVKLTIMSIGIVAISGCSSAQFVKGNIESDVDYEIMGKRTSFSDYGYSALDRSTKAKVEKQRANFIQKVDEYFLSDNGRDVHGVLKIYDKASK